ncbi:RHS repeat-associated core domain-containing protein [Tannerella forsythia]|uniref:RHS repeat-associated core domain-containing protein n=1 Tax=Tannerella forsythia TaxID=28112 RepID=UPI0009BFC630|nr:RHS repeat-associated core domain-containing protein [Tannerella forsythia]
MEESDVTTWLFEEGTFILAAKIVGDKSYSIITDYLGTPTEMYNSNGEKTWSAELDIYGSVRTFAGRSLSDCPFRYQGQYEDEETGLYYNRFRYYSPDEGMYISQDPIRLDGVNPTLYGFVWDINFEIDPFGLSCTKRLRKNMNKANRQMAKQNGAMARRWKKFKGSAAHHIVAGDHMDPNAIKARSILSKHGIDIDDAANGIYLKHMDPNSIQPGAYHRVIHTKIYFENVANRLEIADLIGGKNGVLDELDNIAGDLLFNKKIW